MGSSDSLRVNTGFFRVPGAVTLFSHSFQAPRERFVNHCVKLPACVDTDALISATRSSGTSWQDDWGHVLVPVLSALNIDSTYLIASSRFVLLTKRF